MALPTQFSVTTGKVSPIANPKAPTDLPKKLEAEEVNIASGASLIPSLSATDTDSPSQLNAENAVIIGVPDSLTAQPVTVTIAPDVLSAQPATITGNPDTFTALPVANTDSPDQLTAQSKTVTPTPDQLSAQDKASTPAPVTLTPNAGTPTTPPFPRNHARILYDNLLAGASSISVVDGDNNGQLSIIPNTFQKWTFSANGRIFIDLPSPISIDTVSLGAHNIGSGGYTVQAFYRETPLGSQSSFAPSVTPSVDNPIMFHVDTAVNVSELEIRVTGGASGFIGYISAGVALQMQRPFFNGHTPITDSDVTEYYSNRSESGEIIGQQIRRKGYETQAQWNNIDDGWYRSYFAPFKQYVKTRPFFFAWNLLEYPDDVGFCRINQDIRSPIQNGSTTKRTVNMTLLGAG